MAARAPIALTPYLLLVRIVLFLVFVIAGIQDLRMVEFSGEDAVRIRRLEQSPESRPILIETDTTSTNVRSGETQEDGTYRARALCRSALAMEDAGWNSPLLLAWIGALTQLVGGALLLPGLLSRLCGFGLCVVLGAGFTLTSWPLVSTSLTAFTKLPMADFNQVTFHLGFFIVALGILVCGGGGISLDRMIFGGPSKSKAYHEDEEFEEE